VRVIAYACYLAGSRNLIAKIRSDVCGPKIRTAIARHDTPALFDWLVEALSYQGISDRVAYDYMQRHGCITWADIDQSLSRPVSCPKLRSYWHYYDCSYQKSHGTCGEPNHISRCPVPAHNLRNGRLNQTAYALYLFIRDIADCDLVAWIDGQLGKPPDLTGPDQLALVRDALIAPLRNVHGISDKVIAMALSSILLAAPREKRWRDAGAGMIAIDTLVHNFLRRTGILRRFAADHPLWGCVLQAGWVRGHHSGSCRADRRAGIWPGLSQLLSAIRSARHLAILCSARSRYLQRQADR